MVKLARLAAFGTSLLVVAAASASAQRGPHGTMGLPRLVPAPTATASGASAAGAPSTGALPPGRGNGGRPGYPAGGVRRSGDLPWLVGSPPRRERTGYTMGTGYGGSSRYNSGYSGDRGTRYWQPPSSHWGVGAGCVGGCIHSRRFFGSVAIGYPFAVAVYVPYFYDATYSGSAYESDGGIVNEPYAPEPERAYAPSKLIVIGGGTGGGGDALTVETIADSVRLSWLASGRAAREVTLFVADSTQRRLATRSTSPAAPTATFEIATLSAPVAYAGVAVTFADGVTTTTLVPYRGGPATGQRR
jgi:hypothetical protein